jgi:hypothetical protein
VCWVLARNPSPRSISQNRRPDRSAGSIRGVLGEAASDYLVPCSYLQPNRCNQRLCFQLVARTKRPAFHVFYAPRNFRCETAHFRSDGFCSRRMTFSKSAQTRAKTHSSISCMGTQARYECVVDKYRWLTDTRSRMVAL